MAILACGDREEPGGAEGILATLVAMVALTGGGATLPRHLHRAVVKLLLPAEAAAAADHRGGAWAGGHLAAAARKPKPMNPEPMLRRLGIAVTMSRADFARAAAAKRTAAIRAARPRTMCLPLLDPLGQPFRVYRRYVAAHAAPRIMSLDFDAPYSPLPPPPSPDDPVSAARLMLRLEALGRALDDLPGQARRFARRKARRDAVTRNSSKIARRAYKAKAATPQARKTNNVPAESGFAGCGR